MKITQSRLKSFGSAGAVTHSHDGSTMLLVDIDTRRKPSRASVLQRARIAQLEVVGITDLRSPSGRGWHRYIAVRPAPTSALEVVALQLLFGSDPVREAFNFVRAKLVDRKQVSAFFAKRWDTFYETSRGR